MALTVREVPEARSRQGPRYDTKTLRESRPENEVRAGGESQTVGPALATKEKDRGKKGLSIAQLPPVRST